MINPLSIKADIFNGIMQNITGAFPNSFAINRTVARDSAAGVNSVSFSETLARRLSESEYPGEYEFRRIINEEIASAVDRQSLDLVALLTRMENQGRLNPLLFSNTSGMNAMLGMANPFDTLRFYGSLLSLRQNNDI